MAFGYTTSISPLHRSTALISDIAKQLLYHLHNKRTSEAQRQRPIIFIAHSLGGIVIKEFLHIASNTGNDELASSVCGILFLGTPHRGSHTASFMDVVSGVLKPLLGRPADIIIKDLSSNSRHLQELDQLLRFTLGKIDIYSFYELLPMSPLKKPIVERHSALLNIPSELEQIGLEADHRQMCKPPDRHHFIYETIAQRVISVMNRQIEKAQYSNDLLEMTNKFAMKQMEHIMLLTKELHEGQIGPDVTLMFAIFQQTLNFHVMPTQTSGVGPGTHGFEEVLKTLPVQKAKAFVDGLQRLMDRAKSLQDMLVETERQNERRKAQARLEAERKANDEKTQELMAEIARLKARLGEGNNSDADPSCIPTPQQASVPFGQMAIGNVDSQQLLWHRPGQPDFEHVPDLQTQQQQQLQQMQQRQMQQQVQQQVQQQMQRMVSERMQQQPPAQMHQYIQRQQIQESQMHELLLRQIDSQRLRALQTQQDNQTQQTEADACGRPLHLLNQAAYPSSASPSSGGGLEQNAASASDSIEPLKDSPGSGTKPAQPIWPSRTDRVDDEASRAPVRLEENPPALAYRPPSPMCRYTPILAPEQPVASTGSCSPLEPSSTTPPHTDQMDGEGRKRPRRAAAPTWSFLEPRASMHVDSADGEVGTPTVATCSADSLSGLEESIGSRARKRAKLSNDAVPEPVPSDSPEDHQGEILTETRMRMSQMVGTLTEMLQVGRLVLKTGEPAFDPVEP